MHIHPSSPNSSISEEDAAIKIQAGFRGYRVRKQLKENVNICSDPVRANGNHFGNHHSSQSINHHTIQTTNGCNRSAKRNGELKQQNGALTVGGGDGGNGSGDEEKCATKIQAGVRGYLVRKKQKLATNAATKIQAGFRGFRARKELKKLKE